MNFNEILDYEGRLLILNNETKSLKPVPTVKMPPTKQLRHQESIYLEDYMDTVKYDFPPSNVKFNNFLAELNLFSSRSSRILIEIQFHCKSLKKKCTIRILMSCSTVKMATHRMNCGEFVQVQIWMMTKHWITMNSNYWWLFCEFFDWFGYCFL